MVPKRLSAASMPAISPGTPTARTPSRANSWTGLKRRGFAIVERVESVGLRDVDQHEAAAANSARGRIGDAHCQRGGHGRIDGVAAVFEYLDAGARGVLAFRHDHSMDA